MILRDISISCQISVELWCNLIRERRIFTVDLRLAYQLLAEVQYFFLHFCRTLCKIHSIGFDIDVVTHWELHRVHLVAIKLGWNPLKSKSYIRKRYQMIHETLNSCKLSLLTFSTGKRIHFLVKSFSPCRFKSFPECPIKLLSLIHIWRCRRYSLCRSRWSPYH